MRLSGQLREIRVKAQADLYYFAKYVLENNELYEPLHRQMADLWMRPEKNKAAAWSRGFFKSTMFSIAGPLWECVRKLGPEPKYPPRIPVQCLLAGENEKIVIKFLGMIRWHVEANRRFRAIFPEVRPGRPWQNKQASLERRFDSSLKENTFEIMGQNSNPTSPHYNLIVLDDMLGFSNYGSQEGRDATWEWIVATNPLMLAGGMRMVVGNRWHQDDPIGRIRALNPILPPDERYFIEEHGCYGENGESIFPSVWPNSRLEGERLQDGEELFAAWYLNDPLDPRAARFRPEWVRYWEADDLPKDLEVSISIDPSCSVSKTSDKHGVIVFGASGNDRYILAAESLKCTWAELATRVKDLSFRFQASRLGIEAQGGTMPVFEFFESEFMKGGLPKPMRLKGYTGRERDKDYRITALAPYLEYGCIKVHKSQSELISQLLHYPRVTNDDLVDALAYMPAITPFGRLYGVEQDSPEPQLQPKRMPGQVIGPDIDNPRPAWSFGWL